MRGHALGTGSKRKLTESYHTAPQHWPRETLIRLMNWSPANYLAKEMGNFFMADKIIGSICTFFCPNIWHSIKNY